ncbi:hypothetical protein CPB83DRAFT_854815 [Crepidotus variabilis]|uniref:Uncharacterized protein n=1 Tax=Crepidotus variabilis TaxID=179855 RepID=A0A9P6EFT2_9AGAR|nr:hypothetical protein CPB83DRAFT_854815 [Crepidotus variabilis]
MQFTTFFTALLLLGCSVSVLAAPPRHTHSSAGRARARALGTRKAQFLTSRDVANIVDQILVDRGLVWDAEEADDLMERMMAAGGGGQGHGNGGNGGHPIPPAPPNSPASSPETPKRKTK